MLSPKYLLALQESAEIEHLLASLDKLNGLTILRLPVSMHAQKRTPEARKRFREEKYREYFEGSNSLTIPFSQAALQAHWLGKEREMSVDRVKNLLLGLCDSDNYALALGILQGFDLKKQCLHTLTPLNPKDCERIRIVKIGEITIHPDGKEGI